MADDEALMWDENDLPDHTNFGGDQNIQGGSPDHNISDGDDDDDDDDDDAFIPEDDNTDDDDDFKLDGYDDLGKDESNANVDDDFKLDGYDDLGKNDSNDADINSNDPEHNDKVSSLKRKRTLPGFFGRSTAAAERAAIRARADKTNVFIIDEGDGVEDIDYKPREIGTFRRRKTRNNKNELQNVNYHKKITAELDTDDEMMVNMREKGYSDRQIAEKLAKEGRQRYDVKSVSTRIMRIRVKQAEHVDYLLQEGYKEWEQDEDFNLIKAYALADIELSYDLERLRASRFKKVSDYMRQLNREHLFSAKACRERYSALLEDRAPIPAEEDDDPMRRRMSMERYREERERIREAEQNEKDAKELRAKKIKEEARLRNAQKASEAADRRAKAEEEKAKRLAARAAQAELRAKKAAENMTAKQAYNAKVNGSAATAVNPQSPAPASASTTLSGTRKGGSKSNRRGSKKGESVN